MGKKVLTPAELAEVLGVDEALVRKHIGELLGIIKDETGVWIPVKWLRDLIEFLRYEGKYLLADVLEARLEEWLAVNG